jgi:hypothetical protein
VPSRFRARSLGPADANRIRTAAVVGGALALLSAVASPAAAAPWPVNRPALRANRLAAAAAAPRRITRPTWVSRVTITEYYPAPERWFVGRRIRVAGLPTPHRIDWLFSARGVTMEGDGIGLDGRRYHVDNVGRGGWVDLLGRPSLIGGSRPVFWRAGGFWRNARNQLTFPLEMGGWSNGTGARYVPLPGVSFGPGPSLPLRYYRSLAVDPRLIPMGSRVYIPAYKRWFLAQDTGGAILGTHVDVYRPPPSSSDDVGRYLRNQRILVIPPGQRAPAVPPISDPAPQKPEKSDEGTTGGLSGG